MWLLDVPDKQRDFFVPRGIEVLINDPRYPTALPNRQHHIGIRFSQELQWKWQLRSLFDAYVQGIMPQNIDFQTMSRRCPLMSQNLMGTTTLAGATGCKHATCKHTTQMLTTICDTQQQGRGNTAAGGTGTHVACWQVASPLDAHFQQPGKGALHKLPATGRGRVTHCGNSYGEHAAWCSSSECLTGFEQPPGMQNITCKNRDESAKIKTLFLT